VDHVRCGVKLASAESLQRATIIVKTTSYTSPMYFSPVAT